MDRRGAVRLTAGHLLAFIIGALLVYFAISGGYFAAIQKPAQPQQPQPSAGELVPVNKPLRIALTDPLAGMAIPNAQLLIYTPDKVLRESLVTDSTGIASTALPYPSDSVVYVKISKPGYVTKWCTVTVPRMTQADAQSLAQNFVALQDVQLGSYVIKVTDQFGNTYTSGSALNFTRLGASVVSVTITIYNTKDNSGYVTSRDFINNINLNAVLLAKTSGTSVVVQGAGQSVTRGTDTYYMTVLNDDALTRQIIGNQYVKPGVATVTLTFNKGALGAGQTQAFTFNLMAYFDPQYFAVNGIGGPDAVSLASFTLNLQA